MFVVQYSKKVRSYFSHYFTNHAQYYYLKISHVLLCTLTPPQDMNTDEKVTPFRCGMNYLSALTASVRVKNNTAGGAYSITSGTVFT